jgi:hypothetical protein
MPKPAAAPRCANGARCVAYPTLGEPAKLSRGNPGPRCFACEERRATVELEAAVDMAKDEGHRKASGSRKMSRSRRSGSNKPKERNCMKPSCERPVVKWRGTALLCREHAEESRAAAVWERRSAWVLTCERVVRSAIASGDERLERRWAKFLRAAEVSFGDAEADLRLAEIRARPTTAAQRAQRIPNTG